MEQQSNNRLDELFQKAAEEYPLKTNNKNWDVVAARLHSAASVVSRKKNNKWLYVALLIFLLAGSTFIIHNLNTKQPKAVVNLQTAPSEINNGADKAARKSSENAETGVTNNAVQQQLNPDQQGSNLNHQIAFAQNTSSVKNTDTKLSNNQIDVPSNQNQLSQQSNLTKNNLNEGITNKPANDERIASNNNIAVNKSDNAGEKNESGAAVNEKSERINLRPRAKTFYGVFFFSPDFSTVKFQHINKPGYSLGIALGYRINNRISAEVGLQRIHSNFYSTGKYFDTSNSNLKLKGRTRLDDLNGNNKITEVPVAIRYNLLKNSDRLFVTAGTTVAVITHLEKYDYNVMKNNGEQKDVYRKFSALTGTKFFSSVNLSVGYQTSVANLFDLKIEPYYQAATKGLGVGNLPVSNFGVNIGIMKDLK